MVLRERESICAGDSKAGTGQQQHDRSQRLHLFQLAAFFNGLHSRQSTRSLINNALNLANKSLSRGGWLVEQELELGKTSPLEPHRWTDSKRGARADDR